MKKLMLIMVCVFTFGSANVVLAQDPVKPATEQTEECTEEKTEEATAEEDQTEETAESSEEAAE